MIKVLNHGFIELIDYMGSDLTVVNAARVSFSSLSDEFVDKDAKLIKYLAKHNHWTPFAHPQFQFRIKAPIAEQRQWFKHKQGAVENSESTRYIEVKPEFYIPEKLRLQAKDKKQGSDGTMKDTESERLYLEDMESLYVKAYWLYKDLIAEGVAHELARNVLPLATFTTWIWSASLATCARVFSQRSSSDSQQEIREYANAMAKLIEPLFPASWEALTGK